MSDAANRTFREELAALDDADVLAHNARRIREETEP